MKNKDKHYHAREGIALLSTPFAPGECPLSEQPRPQFARAHFEILNGKWEYAIRKTGETPESYDGKITVPFSPEFAASGVGHVLEPEETLFYRRSFSVSEIPPHLLLHFDAVDYIAHVSVNGKPIGEHRGGYLPFSFDIADAVHIGENELCVTVTDPTDAAGQARGKQTLTPGGIWYTPQSGIWQTVWLEYLPADYIPSVKITPDIDAGTVHFSFPVDGVSVTVIDGNRYTFFPPAGRETVCPIPNAHLWSPEDPYLYRVIFRRGEDRVESYFGMRKFSIMNDRHGRARLALNNRPYFHNGILDQGYFPESGLTPPSDEAMIHDIMTVKALGMNMLRKHIKVDPMRFYYHCDRFGVLVWQDLVSGGADYSFPIIAALPFVGIHLSDKGGRAHRRFSRESAADRAEFTAFAEELVRHFANVPSLALFTVFNEGWGQFESERLTARLSAIDPTRHYDAVSGWHDQGKKTSTLKSLHIYYKKFRMPKKEKRVVILSEFGGYSCPSDGHMFTPGKLFGYRMYKTEEALREAVKALYRKEILPAVKNGLSAAVYTQLSDVEEEINGILTYDRRVNKFEGVDLSVSYDESDI